MIDVKFIIFNIYLSYGRRLNTILSSDDNECVSLQIRQKKNSENSNKKAWKKSSKVILNFFGICSMPDWT